MISRWLLLALVAGCCTTASGHGNSPVAPSPGPAASFNNDLAACVTFTPENTELVGNVVLLRARLRVQQSIGACGCKSSVLGYRVRRANRPPSNMDIVGRVNTLARQSRPEEDVRLVLATDASMLPPAQGATVQVTCTDPD